MKKIKFIILLLLCTLTLSACDLYVYKVDDKTSTNDETTNLNEGESGTTIVTEDPDYHGFIDISGSAPTSFTNWNTIYDNVVKSVVTIRVTTNSTISSTGSGVIIAQDNTSAYIYTNAHVVKGTTGTSNVEVLLYNNQAEKGTVIGYDNNEDVAVVKINKRSDYTVAKLRDSSTLKIGEAVMSLGSPLGENFANTATSGIISNLNVGLTEENSTTKIYFIQIDASLNPGNSGGPLFDNAGNLIGINTMKLLSYGSNSDIESFNYAIPISHFYLVANYLLQSSLYYRPVLNITVEDISYYTFYKRENLGITRSTGLLISEIKDTSPLKGKATVNQIITHIEGIEIERTSDFSVELLKHAPGDTISITICNTNGTNSQTINVTLTRKSN